MRGPDIWESRRCPVGSPLLTEGDLGMRGIFFPLLTTQHGFGMVGMTCRLSAWGAPGDSVLGFPWRQRVASLRWHVCESTRPSQKLPGNNPPNSFHSSSL